MGDPDQGSKAAVATMRVTVPNQRHRRPRLEFVRFGVLAVCILLLVRTFLLDAYHVPTGSMAPTLVGRHRECICPRCGHPVQVGLHEHDDGADETQARLYQRAWCPNCSATGLALHQAPVAGGQRLVVDKTAFVTRSPRRWEIVVFHLFGLDFIKRILGLPGESVEIKEGDLYVNGILCRKTLDECKAMRILVFDNNHQPKPMTWAPRWESAPQRADGQLLTGTMLNLDGTQPSDSWHLIAYRNYCLNAKKSLPITDEYAYNGAEPNRTVPVHDLMLECDLEIQHGQGAIALGIYDGQDHLIAQISTGDGRATLHSVPAFSVPVLKELGHVIAEVSGVSLTAGKRYHVDWAFVDRRLTLAIDGVTVFVVDRPECEERAAVVRPVMLAARGVKAVVSNIRLWRDVHYTQDGKNGVGGAVVRLGPEQYFVLGDNSPRSEDSRFWPNGGAVPASALLGAPLFVQRLARQR